MPGAAASCTSAAKGSPQASVISGFSTQTQGSVAPASARLWFVPKPTGRALPRICSTKGQPPVGGKGGASGKFSVSTTRRTVALLSRAKSSSRRCTSGPWPWLTTETTKSPGKGEKQVLTPSPAQRRGIPAVLPMGCSGTVTSAGSCCATGRFRPGPRRPLGRLSTGCRAGSPRQYLHGAALSHRVGPGLSEPWRFGAVAPRGQAFCQHRVAEELAARRVAGLLQHGRASLQTNRQEPAKQHILRTCPPLGGVGTWTLGAAAWA